MKPSGIITLITDFGLKDWYVGSMKGVILGINSRAIVVDVTHGVDSGDVVGAGIALRGSYAFFPRGTVHVVVVDPGVGGSRALLCVSWQGHLFLAPDNGILPIALGREAMRGARSVENAAYRQEPVSRTFHGRDILAPAAARLARGLDARRLGPRRRDVVMRELPRPRHVTANSIRAEVIHIDQFGNLLTNISEDDPILKGSSLVVRICGREIAGLSDCYCAVSEGEPLALCGSSGLLEISVNGRNAAEELDAQRGTVLTVARREKIKSAID
jgi:S-adenosylmethionine hydrolase